MTANIKHENATIQRLLLLKIFTIRECINKFSRSLVEHQTILTSGILRNMFWNCDFYFGHESQPVFYHPPYFVGGECELHVSHICGPVRLLCTTNKPLEHLHHGLHGRGFVVFPLLRFVNCLYSYISSVCDFCCY